MAVTWYNASLEYMYMRIISTEVFLLTKQFRIWPSASVPVKGGEIFLLSPEVWDKDHTQSNKPHSYRLCISLVHGKHANELRISQKLKYKYLY